MNGQLSNTKSAGKVKKEIEDFVKTWVHKNFQRGIKEIKITITDSIVVILGIDFLTVVEQSLVDDEYSKILIVQTRKRISDKNFPVLKQNIESITLMKVENIYIDFSVDTNTMCMTIFLKGLN